MQTKNVNVTQPATSTPKEKNVNAANALAMNNGDTIVSSPILSRVNPPDLGHKAMEINGVKNRPNENQINEKPVTVDNSESSIYQVMTPPPSYQHIRPSVTQTFPPDHSPFQAIPSNAQVYQSAVQPYSSGGQTSTYQGLPLNSMAANVGPPSRSPEATSPYQPPPLPPRSANGGNGRETRPTVIQTASNSFGAYKPVPPPKPFAGTSSNSSGLSGSTGDIKLNGTTSMSSNGPRDVTTSSHLPLKDVLGNFSGSTRQAVNGTPPLLSHVLVTDQGHFHTHSAKFPPSNGGPSKKPEERDHLITNGERHIRFSDGIDNPALVEDNGMPSNYRQNQSIPSSSAMNHGQRSYESPYMSHQNYRTSQSSQHQHQQQLQNMQNMMHGNTGNGSQHIYSQNHSSLSQNFTRETWNRNSQGPHFSNGNDVPHLQPHMNGHAHPHSNGHIPNGHLNGHNGQSNGQMANQDHGYMSPTNNSQVNPSQHNHHNQMNGHADSSGMNGHIESSQSNNKNRQIDENLANSNNERQEESRKDDRWGSLKRASKKYHHFKDIISSKFTKDMRDGEQNSATQTTGARNTETQNGRKPIEMNGIMKPTDKNTKYNHSARESMHQQKNQQPPMSETTLTTTQSQTSPGQSMGSSLPPQYPRSPHQYRSNGQAQGPLTPSKTYGSQRNEVNSDLQNRRSGSVHQLSQMNQQTGWRTHHYSVDNLVDNHTSPDTLMLPETNQLPSDHTYSGPTNSTTNTKFQQTAEGHGSCGSDSGRGTAGSGTGETRGHDTSLDSATSNRQQHQEHSSGNDSEWVDMTDSELQRIMKKPNGGERSSGRLVRRESLAATPPLPPLSPEASPNNSPTRARKYSVSHNSGAMHKPDLLEAANSRRSKDQRGTNMPNDYRISHHTPSKNRSQNQMNHNGKSQQNSTNQNTRPGISTSNKHLSNAKNFQMTESHMHPKNKINRISLGNDDPSGLSQILDGDLTSTTDALDLDSMLDGATEATSDDATSMGDPDVHLIRRQLEGLEGMYSEVLKLLGGVGNGRRGKFSQPNGDLKTSRRRLHGSLSSLPSSIVSSRPGRDKRRVLDDRLRRAGRDTNKTVHKRFQRLESHVVTLARSVAHLSSEMRTQHLMFQEIENIRSELSALRTGNSAPHRQFTGGCGGTNRWEAFKAGVPGLSNPGRVKKLTQFFGAEPPLVRLFLRKLGYEKYATIFEQEKIGMLELPYLSEERLQKIGIPMGPRLRILQEAQGPIKKEGNLSVYVV